MGKYIDLHVHSILSDGRYTPQKLITMAKDNNVGTLSITDHDIVDAYNQFDMASINDIRLIPGIEVSSYIVLNDIKKKIHILGYDYDKDNSDLLETLEKLKEYRTNINVEYLTNLKKIFTYLDSDIYDKVDCTKYYRLWWAINQYMLTNNYSQSEIQEVKKYTLQNYPEYTDYDIHYTDTINMLHKAGGKAILAHPYQYKLTDKTTKELIIELLEKGADGFEAYHSECQRAKMDELKTFADELGVLYTCGSDFHFPTQQENKKIGLGIENNLCIEQCSFLEKRLVKRNARG